MTRSLIAAALFGYASCARVQRKRASTTHVGSVPVYGEAAGNDRFLVYFDAKTPDSVLEDFCAGKCAFQGHPESGGVPFVVMHGESDMTQAVFANQNTVQSVEHDGDMVDYDLVEEQSTAATWGLQRVGVSRARGTGEGVNIYVLDSGVRVTHQDFEDRAIPTLNAMTLPPKVCSASDISCAADGRGHGSHCAGSAGGKTYGVAPKSTIRAMNRGRSYGDAFASMDWLAMKHMKPAVLTMSFGAGGQAAGSKAAVDAVVAQGVTVTVAAGNNNRDACQFTFAYIPSAITVGSSDSLDRRSSFSNYGSCVTLFGPGSSIPSADYRTDSGERVISGTSMACPHVAGGAAVLLGNEPSLSPQKVKERLVQQATADALSDAKGSPNLLLNVGV